MHTEWADFGEEMSHVQGAVVVRRPDLTQVPGVLAPANSLDFVQTLQSYFTIFKSSLFPSRCARRPCHEIEEALSIKQKRGDVNLLASLQVQANFRC